MRIRIRETGDIITDTEFRLANPNTSFPQIITPEILDSFGADPVLEGQQPTPTIYQYVVPDGVEQINGKWFTKYALAPTFDTQEEWDAWVAQKDAELAPPVPDEISDRQFFHALALTNQITQAEALAAVKTGTLPAAFEAFITTLPEDEQFSARMLLEGATTFRRSHPLTMAFGAMSGMTDTQIDDLWRLAASL